MKNKKTIYILLPLALIIWGTIFWKLFVSVGDVSIHQPSPSTQNNVEQATTQQKDYELRYNYPDPFLKDPKKKSLPKETVKNTPNKRVNRVVRWPSVQFKGTIKSRRKTKIMGVLHISNKKYLVREDQIANNIRVLTITPDSIGLEYQNDKRYFHRHGL